MNDLQGNRRSPAVVLTIAGFDPTSGAGITADLKTIAAHRLYGIACATALTVQSTMGVRRVEALEAGLVMDTLACLTADIAPDGIKIGMLANADVAAAICDFLGESSLPARAIVLDPVVRSSSGAPLLDEAGMHVVRERLLGQVGWITPNIDELAALLGEAIVDAEGIPAQAARLQQMAAEKGNPGLRVVVTGGHLEKPDDYLLNVDGKGAWAAGEMVETTATHGTGCAFSTALVCQVIAGAGDREGVVRAKAYVAEALRHAYPIGRGKGPLHALFEY